MVDMKVFDKLWMTYYFLLRFYLYHNNKFHIKKSTIYLYVCIYIYKLNFL